MCEFQEVAEQAKRLIQERIEALEDCMNQVEEMSEGADADITNTLSRHTTTIESHDQLAISQTRLIRAQHLKKISAQESLVRIASVRLQGLLGFANSTQFLSREHGMGDPESLARVFVSAMVHHRTLVSIQTFQSVLSAVCFTPHTIYIRSLPTELASGQDASNQNYVSSGFYPITRSLDTFGDFSPTMKTAGDPQKKFSYPNGLIINPLNGLMYIADCCNAAVVVLNSKLEYVRSIKGSDLGSDILKKPISVAVTNDGLMLAIVDQEGGRVLFLDAMTYSLIKVVGSSGTGAEQLNEPWFIATDFDDNFYISDRRNKRVQKISRDGRFITKFQIQDDAVFRAPYSIMVNDDNKVLVVPESDGNHLFVYSTDGVFEKKLPIQRTGSSFLLRGPDGTFAISDWSNSNITFFDMSGTVIKSFSIVRPVGAAFDTNGQFFAVTQDTEHMVVAL